jgi:hypothetical protein
MVSDMDSWRDAVSAGARQHLMDERREAETFLAKVSDQ